MPRINRLSLLLTAFLLFLLAGCDLLDTPTPWPTFTPRPTASITPSPSPTITLTPTPTQIVPAQAGTPLPGQPAAITLENAAMLEHLATWGKGIPLDLVFSTDGSQIGVVSTQGLFVYDAASLEEMLSLQPGVSLRSLAFHPQEAQVAAGAENGRIYLWDEQGNLLEVLEGPNAPIAGLAFSPDGRRLASTAWNQGITLWNLQNGARQQSLAGGASGFRTLTFSADGSRLYAWSPREHVLIWSIPEGRPLEAFYTGVDAQNRSGSSGGFSPEGGYFAVDQDVRVRLLDLQNRRTLYSFNVSSAPYRIAAAPDGEHLAVLDAGGLKIWQGSTLLNEFEMDASAETRLVYSPDGTRLATLGSSLQVWAPDGSGAALAATPNDYQSGYRAYSFFDASGDSVFTALLNGGLHAYRLADGRSANAGGVPAGPTNAIAYSADGSLAAGALGTYRIQLWDAQSGEALQSLRGHRGQMASALAFSPDGGLLASGSSGGEVILWSVADGTESAVLEAAGAVNALQFTPDGRRLLVSSLGLLEIWNVEDGTLQGERSGTGAVLSPDGSTLALASLDDERQPQVLIQPAGQNRTSRRLPAGAGSMAFSPGADLLAVSGTEVSLWDVAGGRELLTFPNPAPYARVLFSPDGRLLLLAAWDGVYSIHGVP
jgi:WD40 repeat protein